MKPVWEFAMSLLTLDNVELQRITGHEDVPEMFVHIAKYSVMAKAETESIAELLGIDPLHVREVQASEVYRDIRLVIATQLAESEISRDVSYDRLEELALESLVRAAQFENDIETLLKMAQVANRAERRTKKAEDVLNPLAGNVRVPLKLSERITRKINSDGSTLETRERSVSVTDGSAVNPSFEKIENELDTNIAPSREAYVEREEQQLPNTETYVQDQNPVESAREKLSRLAEKAASKGIEHEPV